MEKLYVAAYRRWESFRAVASRGPLLSLLVAIAPLIAGLCASVDPSGITRTTVAFFSSTPIAPVVTLFWISVLVTGLAFGLSQSQQAATTRSLVEVVRRLQTLPPTGYVNNYRDQYRAVLKPVLAVALSPGTVPISAVDEAVRTLLASILEVARDYDVAEGSNYGANVMMWRPLGEKFEQPSTVPLVRLVMSNPPTIGHLELVTELSTTTSSPTYLPDASLVPMVVPVPVDTTQVRNGKGRSQNPVIPGAAQAFTNRSIVAYESIDEIFQWLDEEFAADPTVVLDIKRYFDGKGSGIRSFASLPILAPTSKIDDEPIAVLNLHSDRDGILHDNGQTLFAPLLEPFLTLLAILLIRRRSATSSSSNPSIDQQGADG